MNHPLKIAALALAMLAAPQIAHADENYFAYSYGSETLPKGATEAYLWVTDRRDKDLGSYNAQDYKFELEHGFSDRFQASAYVNFVSHHIKGLAPELGDQNRNFAWNGMQASFKYALTSPYTDGIGVAIYVEPGFSRFGKKSGKRADKLSLETKLLLQKNFMNDKLIAVANVTAEQEFEHEGGSDWESELEFELSGGLAYNVAPGLHLGAEGRYSAAYENFPNQFQRADYAMFFGPTIHYATRKWWATLSYQPQVSGGPKVRSNSLNLADYEKQEIRLKLGYNF